MFDESSLSAAQPLVSSIACNKTPTVASAGKWVGDDPLDSLLPVFLIQMIIFFTAARMTNHVLQRFGEPSAISYVIGGILVGPSFVGRFLDKDPTQPHTDVYWKILGPEKMLALDTFVRMGDMFFTLVIGVKTDLNMLKRSGKKAVAIGITNSLLPLGFTYLYLWWIGDTQVEFRTYGMSVGGKFSLSSFIVLAMVLDEFAMLTSKLGRIALSSALVTHMVAVIMTVIGNMMNFLVLILTRHDVHYLFLGLGIPASTVGVILLLRYVVAPAVQWMIKRTTHGQDLSQRNFMIVITFAIGFALLSEMLGYSYNLGMLILGMAMPAGPPLGSALVRRLDRLASGVIIPIYMAQIGCRVDMFGIIQLYLYGSLVFFVLAIVFAKFIGVFGPCIYCRMPLKDAFLIGLMLNSRGISEMSNCLIWRQKNLLNDEQFSFIALLLVVLSSITAILLKVMYKPSMRFISYRRRTVQHTKPGDSLRVLVGIHEPHEAPPMIRLLDSSHPSDDSPIHAYVLHFVPLIGHAAAVLAPLWREGLHKPPEISRITAAFDRLERRHPRRLVVLPYVSMAPYVSMHDDVCALALDKKAALVLLPFHCRNASYRNTCVRVLSYAPCSVGILINNTADPTAEVVGAGVGHGFASVAVIFLGGPDDREALAYASRIAQGSAAAAVHVVWFRLPEEWREGGRDDVLDEAMMRDFRGRFADERRVTFREEVVRDGPGMVSAIRQMCNGGEFGLVIVGRREGMRSQLTLGLEEWSDFPELGIIGDMLASSDFEGKVSTLVLQQQTRVGGHVSR